MTPPSMRQLLKQIARILRRPRKRLVEEYAVAQRAPERAVLKFGKPKEMR